MSTRQAGFTLLELLVALVVFGLLMVGLTQTVRYGLTAWSVERRGAAGPEALAAADGALRRLLEQAAPTRFTGTPDDLTFTTILPRASGVPGGLADVRLLTGRGGLLLRWAPHPPGKALVPPPAPQTDALLPDVTAIRLSYLTPQPSAAPVWMDHWRRTGAPLLVRIGFTFGGAETWPDLVAAPVAVAP